MPGNVIPDDIRQFLLQHIDSIAQLEGLLMFRAHPQKLWNADSMAGSLFINESQAAALLTRLMEQGFVVKEGKASLPQYRYQPKSPECMELIERLADLYRQYLVPITNLIHAKSKTRVQEFADAFRIRKD